MSSPCRKGGMRLSEALDNMQLAYNPITKQLHFVSPKLDKPAGTSADDLGKPAGNFVEESDKTAGTSIDELDKPAEISTDEVDKLSKKSSFSDEGNFSLSTCEKSDASDSPRSTLQWSGVGHSRGKDGGSFSSTVSSLSECSLGSSGRDEEVAGDVSADCAEHDPSKLKKKGIYGFFSRGVFQWKSSKSSDSTAAGGWRLFGRASLKPAPGDPAAAPASAPAPHQHRRQGSAASDDLVASSIALIQHDRPSNLPAKCTSEALRHRAEHLRVVAAARRRVEREAHARQRHALTRARLEDTLSAHTERWRAILAEWPALKNSKRTQDLWWCGLPPPIRGKVWQLAIENKLGITEDTYQQCVAQAREKLHLAHQRRRRLKVHRQCDRAQPDADDELDKPKACLPRKLSEPDAEACPAEACPAEACPAEAWRRGDDAGMELIQLDIARTFPQLCMFQPGGPYFDALHDLLAAYVCYRPDIGYVQGMSFIAAVLLLNMEAAAAFTCFANLLCGRVLAALYERDGGATTRLWRAYSLLLAHHAPALAPRAPPPELYLLEWGYTAFAKAMPLDAACRVWDLMLRDGDLFLFRAAIGVMLLYSEQLQEMDMISAAQFLTRLPDELDAEALFRCISEVSMTLHGTSFHQLADQCDT